MYRHPNALFCAKHFVEWVMDEGDGLANLAMYAAIWTRVADGATADLSDLEGA